MRMRLESGSNNRKALNLRAFLSSSTMSLAVANRCILLFVKDQNGAHLLADVAALGAESQGHAPVGEAPLTGKPASVRGSHLVADLHQFHVLPAGVVDR